MIACFFGLPGSGKTTILTAIADSARQYDFVFSNVKSFNTIYLSSEQVLNLGNFTVPEHSLILIDEAGIDFNNRSYKTFPKNLIFYLKMARHYKVDFVFFSQTYNDFDISIRRLTDRFYRVKKFGLFSFVRRIDPILVIDDENHDIVDGYKFSSMISRLWNGRLYSLFLRLFGIRVYSFFEFPFYFVFRPKYYKFFNSWDKKELPLLSNFTDSDSVQNK